MIYADATDGLGLAEVWVRTKMQQRLHYAAANCAGDLPGSENWSKIGCLLGCIGGGSLEIAFFRVNRIDPCSVVYWKFNAFS